MITNHTIIRNTNKTVAEENHIQNMLSFSQFASQLSTSPLSTSFLFFCHQFIRRIIRLQMLFFHNYPNKTNHKQSMLSFSQFASQLYKSSFFFLPFFCHQFKRIIGLQMLIFPKISEIRTKQSQNRILYNSKFQSAHWLAL